MIGSLEDPSPGRPAVATEVGQPMDLSREAGRTSQIAIEPGGRSEDQTVTTVSFVAEPIAPGSVAQRDSEVAGDNEEIRQAQVANAELNAILRYKQRGRQPDQLATSIWPEEAKELLLHWNRLMVKNGILYRQYPPTDGSRGHLQWILPAALRKKFVETLHADLGHLGEVETCNAVARCVYFPGWRPYTELIVQMCEVCQKPPKKTAMESRRRGPSGRVAA